MSRSITSEYCLFFLSQWDVDTVDQKYRNIPPYTDTRENRIRWFVHCLKQLKALNIKSVGLPYQIGCGLAGGDWTTYFEIIQEFARESNIGFFIVRPSFVQV
jgi:O-acetyl-ADP-ribose deacetylase (regulator of RNase III)